MTAIERRCRCRRRPDAGSPPAARRPDPHRPGAVAAPARRPPEPTTPCRSPTPTSSARPARQIREVTPQEVDALARRRAPRSSTSARRPSGSRATCPAPATSPRATSSSRSRPPRPTATRRSILYCAGGVRSLFAAQTLAEMGYTDVASMSGGFQALEGRRASTCRDAGRPDRRAEAALQPPPADPRGRLGRPGEAARLEGAAHRRRRPRLARRRSTSPPPASARSASSTSTSSTCRNLQRQIIHTTDRVGERKVESARKTINALNPDVKVVAHEEMLVADNVERIIAGYDVILDGTDTFETRYILNDAAVAAGIPVVHASVFRFEGQLTTFIPYEGPCYRCLYPTPPPPELAPGCSVAGVLGVVPGHHGPAPGQRGAQGAARDRRHAGRPAAAVRCARDRVHRAQAAPRPELPGLLRRGRRGARRPAAR